MTFYNMTEEVCGENKVQTLTEENECTITRVTNKTGDMVMTSYCVFPGITLIYNDVHMQEFDGNINMNYDSGSVFEINHCREGRIECSYKDGFFYLSPGDLSISRKSAIGSNSYFPSGQYHGVSFVIDVDVAPRCLSCFLNDVNVRPDALMKKFCDSSNLFVSRSDPRLEHIFSELYSIPEEVRKGYFKIKVLEILLFLSCMESEGTERKMYSATQVNLAKEICKYLTLHMDEHITIEDLSKSFHVSPTQLKNCFKGVYGVSLYSFIRREKMKSAASMLKTTEKTVLEIANLHGYDNGSKFASAFRAVMGKSPNEYRKQNS